MDLITSVTVLLSLEGVISYVISSSSFILCKDKSMKPKLLEEDEQLGNIERFWQKVQVGGENECWPWLACSHRQKFYPIFTIKGKNIGAHRFSWELKYGKIPEHFNISHICLSNVCVNPKHLLLNKNRGNPVRSKLKTHCLHGHELKENFFIRKRRSGTYRICKTCNKRQCIGNNERRKLKRAGLKPKPETLPIPTSAPMNPSLIPGLANKSLAVM